jgi:hypothetical protein
MRRIAFALLAGCLVLGQRPAICAEKEDAWKVVEKAIKALSGKTKPGQYKAAIIKMAGTAHVAGRPVACTGRIVYQPPLQYSLTFAGRGFKMTTVFNGDKGWIKRNGTVITMDKEQISECKELLHVERVAGLVALKEKGFELSLLGGVYFEGIFGVGIKVKSKGHRDVKLYFDSTSGRLARMEVQVKDNGKLVLQETLFSDYKDFGGLLRPRKVVNKRDGKDFTSWEVTEYKPLEKKVSDREFARP